MNDTTVPVKASAKTTKAGSNVKARTKAAPQAAVASQSRAPKELKKGHAAGTKKTAKAAEKASPKAGVAAKSEKVKQAKPAKQRMVRDSFKMPETEYACFDIVKQRLSALGKHVKKSEILRASLSVLTRLTDAEVLASVEALTPLKQGRPAKESATH